MEPVLVGSSRHAAGVARSLRRALAQRDVACPLSLAQETVARMFGHRDWHGLVAASEGRPASPGDDEAGQVEPAARRRRQAAVLADAFGLPASVAEAVVDAVRPTGRRNARRLPTGGHPALEAALRGKARLRCFRSGGGLRVIRVEKGAGLVGYGEAPTFAPALGLAEDDVAAGGRPYGDVYGKLVPHYMTGAYPDATDPLDEWVFAGNGLAVAFERGRFVARLKAMRFVEAPDAVAAEAWATQSPVSWEARGMRYLATPYEGGMLRMCCVDRGDGTRNPDWFHAVRTGEGAGIAEALAAALDAPEVEQD